MRSLLLNSAGALRLRLSSSSVISARFRAGRCSVPAKMTSSISLPRIFCAEFSPMTHRNPSTILDLPQPFGPTMPVRPLSMSTSAASAKDLNPAIFRLRKITISTRAENWSQVTVALILSANSSNDKLPEMVFSLLMTKDGVDLTLKSSSAS